MNNYQVTIDGECYTVQAKDRQTAVAMASDTYRQERSLPSSRSIVNLYGGCREVAFRPKGDLPLDLPVSV